MTGNNSKSEARKTAERVLESLYPKNKANALALIQSLTPAERIEAFDFRFVGNRTVWLSLATHGDFDLMFAALDGISIEHRLAAFNVTHQEEHRGSHNVWDALVDEDWSGGKLSFKKDAPILLSLCMGGLSNAQRMEVLTAQGEYRNALWRTIAEGGDPDIMDAALEGLTAFQKIEVRSSHKPPSKLKDDGSTLTIQFDKDGTRTMTQESMLDKRVTKREPSYDIKETLEDKLTEEKTERSWVVKVQPTEDRFGKLTRSPE